MAASALFKLRVGSGEEFGPAPLEALEQWAREGRVPMDALLIPADGGPVRSVLAEPRLRVLLQVTPAAPPTVPGPVQAPDTGMSKMIPYRNPPALIGYYASIASLIPLLGIVAGPLAIGFGIAGLRRRLKDPSIHGLAHAWIAIILGGIGTLGNGLCIASGFFAYLNP